MTCRAFAARSTAGGIHCHADTRPRSKGDRGDEGGRRRLHPCAATGWNNAASHGRSARRIHTLSREELSVEEGSLYPALQKLLLKGWVKASPAISETGRQVREYKLTPAGRKQLDLERANYRRVTDAIGAVLDSA